MHRAQNDVQNASPQLVMDQNWVSANRYWHGNDSILSMEKMEIEVAFLTEFEPVWKEQQQSMRT